MNDARTSQAIELMMTFAERTGLSSRVPARRYLWTDAFAVCNFLGLRRATGDERYLELALRLVDQVHRELGRHREGERRSGWISGLSEEEGEAHPTSGGLRIGKRLPERAPSEPLDPDLEWDRDGQYFHYLTKWMHALDQLTRATGRPVFNLWARELASTAHRTFTYGPPERKRMAWKLSVDLSRPLVRSMGQHDPLDGFVTCAQLAQTARELGLAPEPDLATAMVELARMIDTEALETSDLLGIGGLLVDAERLSQLGASDRLLRAVLAAAASGLRDSMSELVLRAPAHHRLGFRELGLAIGLAGLPLLEDGIAPSPLEYASLRDAIESFWLDPEHRRASTWLDHHDINDVMLATSLVPDGFLVLAPAHPPQESDRTESRA